MYPPEASDYKLGLYVSHDAGKTWEIKSVFNDAETEALSIVVNPDDESNWFVSAGKYFTEDQTSSDYRLYVSEDNGKTVEKRFVLTDDNKEENKPLDEKKFYKLRFGPKNEEGIRPLYRQEMK